MSGEEKKHVTFAKGAEEERVPRERGQRGRRRHLDQQAKKRSGYNLEEQ